MAIVKPFKGIRPITEKVEEVVALPYDVMNRDEALNMAKDKEDSFLHISRSEIDFPISQDPYDLKVYEKARENLHKKIESGVLKKDPSPYYYLYRQKMEGRTQTGIVGVTSIDEYLNNDIKKHEYTRPEKEEDRFKHFDICNGNTEPVFFAYRAQNKLQEIFYKWIEGHKPIYDFTTNDGVDHQLWVIDEKDTIKNIEEMFQGIPALYIADGHHRTASAVRAGLKRRAEKKEYTGKENFNFILSVIFPDEELKILDYNRVVRDLNGLSTEAFIDKLKVDFTIMPAEEEGPYKPSKPHHFGMFLEGQWYELVLKKEKTPEKDPVKSLDVSILQNNVLSPILGIKDPRTDKRIDFVGGIRGLKELEKRVKEGMSVAFSLYPTDIKELMSIADEGKVMPPKSTWFEPKLLSGLFLYSYDS